MRMAWLISLSMAGAVFAGCSQTPPDGTNAAAPTDAPAGADCVEGYSPAAVAQRSFAFDGVVLSVGPSVSGRRGYAKSNLPGVRFEVVEWFRGGTDDKTVTVDMQIPSDEYEVGTRLLVSGEARWGGNNPLAFPIAWGCGFTRLFDDSTASAWRSAVSS